MLEGVYADGVRAWHTAAMAAASRRARCDWSVPTMTVVDQRETQGPPPDPPDPVGAGGLATASERERSIRRIRRAMTILRRVIAWNRRFDPASPHAGRAEQRVIDGEIELAVLEAQLAALEHDDAVAERSVAETGSGR